MEDPLGLRGIACVAHVHSTYSDGTATVPELAEAAAEAGVECVLLTDHDTLEARRRGEEGWHGGVLILVGHEVSPKGGHLLVFGVEEEIGHAGRSEREILEAVRDAGGVSIAAHPFSEGSRMSKTIAPPHGWGLLDDEASPGDRALEPRDGLGGGMALAARGGRVPARPDAVPERPAPAPPRDLGRALPPAAGAGDRWSRRAPEGDPCARAGAHADAATRATSGCCRRTCCSTRRRAGSLPRTARRSTGRSPRAGATSRSRRSRQGAASGSGRRATEERCRWAGRRNPGDGRCGRCCRGRRRSRLLRDGAVVHEPRATSSRTSSTRRAATGSRRGCPDDGRGRLWIVSNPVYLRAG